MDDIGKLKYQARQLELAHKEMEEANDKAEKEEVEGVFERMNLPTGSMCGMFYGRKTGRGV